MWIFCGFKPYLDLVCIQFTGYWVGNVWWSWCNNWSFLIVFFASGPAEELLDKSQSSFVLKDPNENPAFLPFGSGTRACVCQKFVIQGIATLFASLLEQYEVCPMNNLLVIVLLHFNLLLPISHFMKLLWNWNAGKGNYLPMLDSRDIFLMFIGIYNTVFDG